MIGPIDTALNLRKYADFILVGLAIVLVSTVASIVLSVRASETAKGAAVMQHVTSERLHSLEADVARLKWEGGS